ncbi:PRTRC system protein C [Spirosoma sp. SC4-14]|uniref:PRTRC system protein C n=1 Tax=Spirosoma sp. SC4-14 TaxID=3128900 RepID=UPI0030CA8E35
MLVVTELERKFTYSVKGQNVTLPDPDPSLSPEAVMNFYSNTYPELISAKITGPEIKNDAMVYSFGTAVMGTKG